jgi:hypothetical protein
VPFLLAVVSLEHAEWLEGGGRSEALLVAAS